MSRIDRAGPDEAGIERVEIIDAAVHVLNGHVLPPNLRKSPSSRQSDLG